MADPRSLIDTYAVYIDGQWVDPDRAAGAGGRYDDISPATETVIASAPDPSHAQVDSAIAAARAASTPGRGPTPEPSSGRGTSTSSARRCWRMPTSSTSSRNRNGAARPTSGSSTSKGRRSRH